MFLSDRVNYDAITERFKELIPKAQEARTIEDFVMLVTIPFQLTVSDYAHLLDEKEYRKGEFATILWHLLECIKSIIPDHIYFVPVIQSDGTHLVFIPKTLKNSPKPN